MTSALLSLFLPFAHAEAQRQVAAATLHYLEYASNSMNVFCVVRRTEPSSQSAKCHAGASRALVLDLSHVTWHFPPLVFCSLVLQTFCHASLFAGNKPMFVLTQTTRTLSPLPCFFVPGVWVFVWRCSTRSWLWDSIDCHGQAAVCDEEGDARRDHGR